MSLEITTVPCGNGTLFLHFRSGWNADRYREAGDFDLLPNAMRAGSTSGAPIVEGSAFVAGFLSPDVRCRFRRKGDVITLEAPQASDIFVHRGKLEEGWARYHTLLGDMLLPLGPVANPEILSRVEYCTWVEQKVLAERTCQKPMEVLDDAFVDTYLRRLDHLGFPPGVFTLDHGWLRGSCTFDFNRHEPDTDHFPDLTRTFDRIRSAGHIPGLWFAPCFLLEDHPFFAENPQAMGPLFAGANEGGFQYPLRYFQIDDSTREAVRSHYRQVFTPYTRMGALKFKLDFTYEDRSVMRANLTLAHEVIKELSPGAEVEGHLADPFTARALDAVRLNDLVIESNPAWLQLMEDHYNICSHGAPQTQLNLDHIGTNSPRVSEHDFRASLESYRGKRGYPVVSLLPDHWGNDTQALLREYLWSVHPRPAEKRQ
ncbi:MAG: hypothetical protein AABZ39_04800 [Spirochaetota bacterium]